MLGCATRPSKAENKRAIVLIDAFPIARAYPQTYSKPFEVVIIFLLLPLLHPRMLKPVKQLANNLSHTMNTVFAIMIFSLSSVQIWL